MSFFRTLTLMCTPFLLAACGGGGGGAGGETGSTTPTFSGPALNPSQSLFVTAFPNGVITLDLENATSDSRQNTQGAGYAMKVGFDKTAESFTAVAGLVSPERLGDAPGSGTVTYSGVFESLHLDRSDPGDPTATVRSNEGTLSLSANFDRRTFTATSDATTGGEPVLNITGSISNGAMTGTTTFRHASDVLTGAMRGQIDEDTSIAAFHANDDIDAVAGGFLVEVD